MAESRVSKQRAPRPRLPLEQKRRIVELTLCEGASIRAIALEHGFSRNSLRRWQALYRAGKLGPQAASRARAASTSGATFVPVTLAPTPRPARSARALSADSGATSVVELMFSSGRTMRIETGALDATLIRTLVAELQR